MSAALATGGNPSSVHGAGRAARRLVEDARERIAALIGADAAGVIFTSGGTEANALALTGTGRRRWLLSAVEHPSVIAAAPGAETIAVDAAGRVDCTALARQLAASTEPALVSVMLANNETGTIQPLPAIVAVARAAGALVHTDAVQALGRLVVDVRALGVDLLTLSAHKLGGPPGVGALIVDPARPLAARQRGGGQERGRRAGTENVPGIAGFAAAAAAAAAGIGDQARLAGLRDRIEAAVTAIAGDARIIAAEGDRLANTTCVALPGIAAATQVMALDLAGIAVSAGAACSSGKVAASHVLQAMRVGDELATCAIRISLGWTTTEADVDRFVAAWRVMADGRGRPGAAVAAAAAAG